MIKLDAATVLLQWAVGGLFFLWITSRGRLLGIGYGWLMRTVYAVIAAGGVAVAVYATGVVAVREVAALGVVVAAVVALVVSILRRKAGVSGQRAELERKKQRVAAMTGAGRSADPSATLDRSATLEMRDEFGRIRPEIPKSLGDASLAEFPPYLDLIAPLIGCIGLVAGGWDAGGNHALAIARTVVGAAFLGVVSDAMLLGHWYLVQPGLPRSPIHELNHWIMRLWPFEVGLLLVPTGMVSAVRGTIDDGWNGLLSWFWVGSAVMTIVLSIVTKAALKERAYSAVMAATGLLYLAILTGFCTDLVARAILAP